MPSSRRSSRAACARASSSGARRPPASSVARTATRSTGAGPSPAGATLTPASLSSAWPPPRTAATAPAASSPATAPAISSSPRSIAPASPTSPPRPTRGDGLALTDIYIAAAARCAPPDNKPTPEELATCRRYLEAEIALLDRVQVVVALGRIGFEAFLKVYESRPGFAGRTALLARFAHAAVLPLGPGLPIAVTSYHPSRQNTQTGRLTPRDVRPGLAAGPRPAQCSRGRARQCLTA